MVINSYLNTTNPLLWNKKPLGQYITEFGYKHLWNHRPIGQLVDTIVIHYMSAIDDVPTMAFDTPAQLYTLVVHKVSAHYLVSRNGEVFALVPEDQRAWHAGGSIMPPPDLRRDVNDFSIGIELSATADSGFTKQQYSALAKLCLDIESRSKKPIGYIGHQHIASEAALALKLRSTPKVDPGVYFNWEYLQKLMLKNDLFLAQRV